jgi:hypothetical protein
MSDSIIKHALPYTLEFELISAGATSALPPLQAYSVAPCEPGAWLIIGGRIDQGLHKFTTGPGNFIPQDANPYLWLIAPESGTATQVLDIIKLPRDLADPLLGTDQQSWYDAQTGYWYIAGGYSLTGNPATSFNMKTWDTLFRIPVNEVLRVFRKGGSNMEKTQAAVAGLFEFIRDPFFQVTGGSLTRLPNGVFVLAAGQLFDGQYDPFGGGYTQAYTNAIRYFRLRSDTFGILDSGSITDAAPDQPLHRRDGGFTDTVDPASGRARMALFGGVFPPGLIAGYLNPVYVSDDGQPLRVTVDRHGKQLFNQYGCPIVVVYDEEEGTVYHTLFGGIGHYYYHQNESQHQVYEAVTKVGRNDGLPFVCDIVTFLQDSADNYREFIAPEPVSGYALHGSSTGFIPNTALRHGCLRENGVLNLRAFPKLSRTCIGYVYGGIEAAFPLPVITNCGTVATNALYKVYLHHVPWDGIPASEGHEAVGIRPANVATDHQPRRTRRAQVR